MKKRQKHRDMTESEMDALTTADAHDSTAWGEAVVVPRSRSPKPDWILKAKKQTLRERAFIHEVPVSSSLIVSIGYDSLTETLRVHFRNGRIYHYLHVPPQTYEGLRAAASIGAFFNTQIRDKYRDVEIVATQ